MFTDAVTAYQREIGVDEKFAKVYFNRFKGDLGEDERAFIESRTSFYLATHNAEGWPYLQHRGGPLGFVKVIGPTRLGFVDYKGNKQFVTRGNLDEDNRVSLFLMDYPRQSRLKLLGHATMIDAADDTELTAELAIGDAPEPERLVTIDVAAMDWNCPKYIEPRCTEAEIMTMMGPKITALHERNKELEAELAALRAATGQGK